MLPGELRTEDSFLRKVYMSPGLKIVAKEEQRKDIEQEKAIRVGDLNAGIVKVSPANDNTGQYKCGRGVGVSCE